MHELRTAETPGREQGVAAGPAARDLMRQANDDQPIRKDETMTTSTNKTPDLTQSFVIEIHTHEGCLTSEIDLIIGGERKSWRNTDSSWLILHCYAMFGGYTITQVHTKWGGEQHRIPWLECPCYTHRQKMLDKMAEEVKGWSKADRATPADEATSIVPCPECNNGDPDTLVWQGDTDTVRCEECGIVYDPANLTGWNND